MGFKVDFGQLEWGTIENKLRGRPEDISLLESRLEHVAATLGGYVRVSRRGRPHIVLCRGDVTYSLSCSYGDVWHIFFPFPSWGMESTHLEFVSATEVIKYFG